MTNTITQSDIDNTVSELDAANKRTKSFIEKVQKDILEADMKYTEAILKYEESVYENAKKIIEDEAEKELKKD